MSKGKVKWYDEIKGYGFILSEDGEELFVHRSGLNSPFSGLQTDDEVKFEKKQSEKGMVAFNVETAK